MKKKLVAMMLTMTMTAALLSACGSGSNTSSDADDTADDVTESDDEAAGDEDDETAVDDDAAYVIGINQFAEHGSLDNCREGFLEGLRQEGISEEDGNLTVIYNNGQADTATVNQISQNYVADEVDLICAIATPSAQSAYNAAMDSDVPVIYTAVTDPVEAELANEDQTPAGNVTGTSDKLPVEAQLQMIREILPEAEKIGILYTTSEVNSESAIREYEELVEKYDFELVTKGVSTTADIPLATDALLEEVDCLNNLTDNTVVSALATILDKADAKGIPVFGSEVEQVKIGCLAAEGLDYVKLGIQTGQMAAKVLRGEAEASEINYEIIDEMSLYLNEAVAEKLAIEVSEATKERAAETYTEIVTE